MAPRPALRSLTTATTLALALTVAACGDDGNDTAADPAAGPTAETSDEVSGEVGASVGTIVDVAASTDGFATLVAAVQAAGVVETLSGDGPFTVFAPTDDAFAAALDALGLTADELLADTDTLDGETVETVNGASVTIGVDGDAVTVDEANVTAVDVAAGNGVIHVIDAVLLPPADG